MVDQLIVSGVLIATTVFVHCIFIAVAAMAMRPFARKLPGPVRFTRDLIVLVLMALWLMVAHALEMGMWAGAYIRLGVFEDFETALYFSSVCYTTLGLGGEDVAKEWQLLPGFNAANGFLLFGMTAAFLLDLNNRLRLNRR